MPFLNPYAERIGEFSEFAFNEPDISRFNRRESPDGWSVFFSRRMAHPPEKLVAEVGCSHGVFLGTVAAAHPRTAFVGVDWKFKVVYRAAKRVSDLKLTNVALLRARAQDLTRVFGDGDLDELWILFPDPWAKKSQLKHRLLQESFLLSAARCLKPGARLVVKTDHPGYFQWMLAVLGEKPPALREISAVAPTERSYRARQIKVRQIEREEDLPKASEAVRALFTLAARSADFWGEGVRSSALFGGTVTQFEKGFIEEGLPIHYVELVKK